MRLGTKCNVAPWLLQPLNANAKYDAMWCFGANTTVDMNQRKNDVILRLVAVIAIGKRCHYNCYDLCSGANRCDDEIVRLQLQLSNDMMQSNVIAIVDFVLRHKSIWNELWFVLWCKSMSWCNQMLVIAIVDFVLCHKSIWKWMMRSFACDQIYER
jgi:hypothetical protein